MRQTPGSCLANGASSLNLAALRHIMKGKVMDMGKTGSREKIRKGKMTGMERKEALTGYLFVAPYLVLFLVFTGIPFIFAFLMSFVNLKYITKLDNLRFVGLDNFIRVFQNPDVRMALFRTFIYSVIYVPLIMLAGFLLAYLLNKGVFMKKTIRSMVFLPYVSNMMAIGIVFKLLLGINGPLSGIYEFFGMTKPLLLQLNLALPTVVVIAVWKGVGLNMLVYLGALQGVSTELIEAAQIDGATKWQQIKNVVLPSISPTTFFLLISSIITSLQNFTVIQALTEGGPGQATTTMAVSIVRTAFTQFETGFASAQALVVFAIVMVITAIQWRGQKKWVNY